MAQDVGDKRTVTLKGIRMMYTDTLLTPGSAVEDGKPKYGCHVLLERDSKHFEQNDAKVRAAMTEAGVQFNGKEGLYKTIIEDDPKRVAYRKGERFKNKDGDIYKGYEGNFAISGTGPAGGKNRPTLYDRHKRKVEEKDLLDVFYSGSYGDAVVSFYGTDKGGLGIFCSIEAIRSHQEGERMGGGVTVTADAFDDLEDDEPFGDDDMVG